MDRWKLTLTTIKSPSFNYIVKIFLFISIFRIYNFNLKNSNFYHELDFMSKIFSTFCLINSIKMFNFSSQIRLRVRIYAEKIFHKLLEMHRPASHFDGYLFRSSMCTAVRNLKFAQVSAFNGGNLLGRELATVRCRVDLPCASLHTFRD